MVYGSEDFKKKLLDIITNTNANNKAEEIYNDPAKHLAYKIACSHADDMAVHLYGDLPVKILNRVRPREDPETKAYRLASYETVTKSTADKGLSIVAKIFNPSLYSIRFEEGNENADKLEEWTMEKYPYCNSVVNYVHEVGLRKMIADPNGIFVVKPSTYPKDQLTRVQPIIKIFGSKNIWYKELDCYLIYLRTQKIDNDIYYFFEWYDEMQIIEFNVFVPKPDTISILETVIYKHNFGDIPAWELKGNTEVMDDGTEVHKSFFEPAISFWNKAINHESDLDGAYINHMHPIRVELAEECDYVMGRQRCKGGNILNVDDGSSFECPACRGSGYKSVKSPFGVYRVDHEKMGESKAGLKPVDYVTVPVEPTAMLEKRIDALLEKGLNALNMDIVNKIGENQSGKAKVIDRGELYDFLYKISSVVFDTHIYNIFHYFNFYMFCVESLNPGSDDIFKNEPYIAKPTMFDITTAVEMINEFKASKEAGINPYYLKVKQMQLNAKEFANDEDLSERLNLIMECDPLPDLPQDQIIANTVEGLYSKYDPIIHANIGKFIERALEEHPEKDGQGGFCNMKKADQYKILVEYAKEIEKENKATIQPLINGQPQIADGNPQQTIQAANKMLDQAAVNHVAKGALSGK